MKFIQKPNQETTLITLVNERKQLLSRMEILTMNMWFNGIQIPVAGIGGVYTPKKYRNLGYARRCLEYALDLLKKNGQSISLLFGIPHFYEKFGFTTIMPWYGVYVQPDSWPILPQTPKMNDYSSADVVSMVNLYHRSAASGVGPIVRDAKKPIRPFYPTLWRNGGVIRILKDRQKRLTGYVWHSEPGTTEFEVLEVGAADNHSFSLILAYLLVETRKRSKSYFIAVLPPDDPFALYLKKFGAKYVVHVKQTGGGMAAILNLKDIIKRVEVVFRQRIRLIKSNLVPKMLTISTEKENTILHLGGNGARANLEIPQKVLTQLLFGYASFSEAVKNGSKSSLKSEIGEMLFPKFYAFTYLKDRY